MANTRKSSSNSRERENNRQSSRQNNQSSQRERQNCEFSEEYGYQSQPETKSRRRVQRKRNSK